MKEHRPQNTQGEESIAFRIGEDLAFYNLRLPENASPAMRQGYEHERKRSEHAPNRFVRKWLQIRINAWRRNRYVDPEVTPEVLQEIDTPVCPVSGIELTHGTGMPTDWSVDRLNNNADYVRDNLAVLSTRVNTAKGCDDLYTMVARAEGRLPAEELCPREWARLATLCAAMDTSGEILVRPVPLLANVCLRWPDYWWGLALFLTLTNESARQRRFYFEYLLTSDLPAAGLACQRRFQEMLADFARLTPTHQRSLTEFAKDTARWISFVNFWQVYYGKSLGSKRLGKFIAQMKKRFPVNKSTKLDNPLNLRWPYLATALPEQPKTSRVWDDPPNNKAVASNEANEIPGAARPFKAFEESSCAKWHWLKRHFSPVLNPSSPLASVSKL